MTFRPVPAKFSPKLVIASMMAVALPLSPAAFAQVNDMQLSMEQQAAIRCSAAFAVVSTLQADGGASEYPELGERGREFFVRSAAQIMEEEGADRAQIADLMRREAVELYDRERLDAVMPACLLLLGASGL